MQLGHLQSQKLYFCIQVPFCFRKVHFTFIKTKTAFIIGFAVSCYRGGLPWCYKQCAPSSESSSTKTPSDELCSASQSTAIALHCVCEHLCFTSILFPISIIKICPKIIASFGFWKRFIGMLYFRIVGKTCIVFYQYYLLHNSNNSGKSR